MSPLRVFSALCVLAVATVGIAADEHPLGPDSKPQDGVPKGEVLQFTFDTSKIFPGTTRDYWVYIPAQYQAEKPACLYVNQDRIQFEAPTVFDNLIHKGEMPVTIGVFVTHGRVTAVDENAALDRFNRSYEYDGLGDNYARFLIQELLPDVETKTASDGRAIRLSMDPNDRAIGGSSSGAVCAFTVAWERPDAFRRVFSSIGTYVGLRGADRYHTLIRKYEPKPIRIFLQDGENDLNIYAGDWWMANQTMSRALEFAGYDVNHVWGDGGHNGKHATAVFPDAMRWLWRDYPEPIATGTSQNGMLDDILLPGEGWELVSEGHRFTEGPAANAKGEVFFNDVPGSKTFKVGTGGKVEEFLADSGKADGQAFSPDGRLYAAVGGPQQGLQPSGKERLFKNVGGSQQIIARDADGNATVIADGFRGNDVVVAHNGNVYVTEPAWSGTGRSKVWLIRPDGEKVVVDEGLKFANGITLSPDQTLLYVADSRSHWVYSYVVKPDGTLAHKQRYYWIHVPDDADDSGADGMCTDKDGRLYVATRMGIQVCDQAGRVNCILPTPNGRVSNVCFGGENFDVLFATCGDKVYKRRFKARGTNEWDTPHKPEKPRL
ncbi:MAG: SMP-30/gluconolactonase/LRE family protein [Planctomycetaceae bacterium]